MKFQLKKKRVNPKSIRLSAESINRELEILGRAPFRQSLTQALMASPDVKSLKRFAKKYPDRWASCVTQLARLSGYNDKIEFTGSVLHQIASMSDAELEMLADKEVAQIIEAHAATAGPTSPTKTRKFLPQPK